MNLWINLGTAWISMLLVFLLSIVYLIRIAAKRKGKIGNLFGRIKKCLRKHHKLMGILLVLTGLIHGLFSSEKVWTLNIGTVAWLVSVLLGINWMVRKRLSRFKGWMYYHRLLTVVFIGIIIWHIVDVGGIQIHKVLFSQVGNSTSISIEPSTINGLDSQLQNNEFKDGTFTGEATGYRAGLIVSVEIKDNEIINIEVTDHNEVNSRFYAKPIVTIPEEIIEAQTTEVDTVSGATFTSIGIINAVNDALSKALISGELLEDQVLPQNRGKGGRTH